MPTENYIIQCYRLQDIYDGMTDTAIYTWRYDQLQDIHGDTVNCKVYMTIINLG